MNVCNNLEYFLPLQLNAPEFVNLQEMKALLYNELGKHILLIMCVFSQLVSHISIVSRQNV